MADQQTVPNQPSDAAAPAPAAPAPAPAGGGSKEVEEGKAFAVLSYVLGLVGIPFFLVPLIMRNNEFSLFHAKQCLILVLTLIVTALVNVIPCIGQIVWLLVAVFVIVLEVMGIINASKGEQKALPLIGKFAEDWFKGIKKV